ARIMHHSPTSRVVIVTACEDKAIRQKAIEEGAVELIGKPFNLRELKDVITKILSYCERNRRIGGSFEVLLGDQYRGQTYNLSMSGMLVLSNVSFDPGTTIGLTVQINTQEQIPLKGQVVRIVDWMSPAVPHRSGGIDISGPATYGLGIKLTEEFPAYSSFINSLMT
ncbi:MAG: PilZ domain-containing protein, partial [Chloroflexota bacterium]